jgi:hypothetical protein
VLLFRHERLDGGMGDDRRLALSHAESATSCARSSAAGKASFVLTEREDRIRNFCPVGLRLLSETV